MEQDKDRMKSPVKPKLLYLAKRLSQTLLFLLFFSLNFTTASAQPAPPSLVGSVSLSPGINLLGIPVNPSQMPDGVSLLADIGDKDQIERLLRMNPDGAYDEKTYDALGNILGPHFLVSVGDAWLVYAKTSLTLNYNVPRICPDIALQMGINLLSFPCAPATLSAYQLLANLGGPTVVENVETFDPGSGRFITTGYRSGLPVGPDFPIRLGHGYLVTARVGSDPRQGKNWGKALWGSGKWGGLVGGVTP